MKSFIDQEYLELCKKLVEQQYTNISDSDTNSLENLTWIPAEKEKPNRLTNIYGVLDLTNVRSVDIKNKISNFTNFKIGKFSIKSMLAKDHTYFAFKIFEKKDKTSMGRPCKMDYLISLEYDDRFIQCNWIQYFTDNKPITIDVVVDIVRWLQALNKLDIFL